MGSRSQPSAVDGPSRKLAPSFDKSKESLSGTCSMCSRRTMRSLGFAGLIVAFAFPLVAQTVSKPELSAPPAAVVNQDSMGFRAEIGSETVQVMVCTETVIHVVAYPSGAPAQGASPQQPWMLDRSKTC